MRIGWIILGLFLGGCSSLLGTPIAPTDVAVATGDLPAGETSAEVPALDTSKHSVPLEQIYFDTFQPINRAVPLTEASPELILSLQDAIPPINNPRFETIDRASWLTDSDQVIGYANESGAWAFPIRILNLHEIVNAELGGEPILISYCPLCYSAIVYSRALLGDRELTFGNTSALYESDMVMLDYETGSYWWQVAGEAIVGPLTGTALTPLPSLTTTWELWQELHPATLVLSRDTGFARNYNQDPFAGYDEIINRGNFAFPVSEAALDVRLLPGSKVLAVKVGNAARAYPISGAGKIVIMDLLEDQEVVIFIDEQSGAGAAFWATVGDQSLSFELRDGSFFDLETGSRLDFRGRAVEGDLLGKQLQALPAKLSFWFAIVAAEPGISVYTP